MNKQMILDPFQNVTASGVAINEEFAVLRVGQKAQLSWASLL